MLGRGDKMATGKFKCSSLLPRLKKKPLNRLGTEGNLHSLLQDSYDSKKQINSIIDNDERGKCHS